MLLCEPALLGPRVIYSLNLAKLDLFKGLVYANSTWIKKQGASENFKWLSEI